MKRTNNLLLILLIGILTIAMSKSEAQNQSEKITEDEKKTVIDSIAKLMTDNYVFPGVGKEIANLITEKYKKGKYKSLNSYAEFSEMINRDLLSVNNDKHLGLRFLPQEIKRMKESEKNKDDSYRQFELMRAKYKNFGFKEVKILTGNIGYVKLNGFYDAASGGETAVAALNFLANTQAIIFDLTDNGGGSPSMIQLISSYFFEEPVHLNSFYIREGDKTKQFWSQAQVSGPKMVSTDLYILTSSNTFSAAEEFTYNMKNLERATIIGEITGGGAHPVSGHIINDHFMLRVPFGRAINPITKTNWEGTGVKPHIETKSDKALDMAWLTALKKLDKKETITQLKEIYTWAIEGLEAKVNPIKIDKKILETYIGKYGPRHIFFENDDIYYQRENRKKYRLIPIKKDYFYLDGPDYFRIRFLKKDGKVIALEGNYEGGYKDRSDKDK